MQRTQDTSAGPRIYTVSEITGLIARALREKVPTAIVEGEISNWRVSPTGHAYFKLRDSGASLCSVMFRTALSRTKFRPKDGMRVYASGAISVYAPQGQYQIQVESLREAGVGDLHRQFLELREKLEREGLFDPAKKKPIPRMPRTVGVVTSGTGAAIRDILNVLHRRFASVQVIFAAVRVQGREAPGEIAHAIRQMNRIENLDVMIVGRGGGSMEDLAAFNDERVARAIFASVIPVISAVGHEIDFTIADFVADLRAATPSAAAELVVQEQAALRKRADELCGRLNRGVARHLERARDALEALTTSYGMTRPLERVQMRAQRVDDLTSALSRATRHVLTHSRGRFQPLEETLRALDPERVLARGYSLLLNERGQIVRDTVQVNMGEEIVVKPERGEVRARVIGLQ